MGNARSNGVAALRPQKLVDRVIEGQATLAATRQQLVTGGFERRDETLHNDGLPGGCGRCAAPGAVPAGRDRHRPDAGADAGAALRPAGPVRRRMEPAHLCGVAPGAAVDAEGRLRPRLQGAHAEADLARLPRGRGAEHLLRQRRRAARDERFGRTRRRLGHAAGLGDADAVPQPGGQPDRRAAVRHGRRRVANTCSRTSTRRRCAAPRRRCAACSAAASGRR